MLYSRCSRCSEIASTNLASRLYAMAIPEPDLTATFFHRVSESSREFVSATEGSATQQLIAGC